MGDKGKGVQLLRQKIQYFLNLEHEAHLSVPKIYEILKEKYVLRDKRRKNQPRGQVPQASSPREVIQMDTIDFGELYAFTAVDIFSKEADILIAPELTAEYARACRGDLEGMCTWCRRMVALNLKATSVMPYLTTVSDTGSPDPIVRTSNRLSRASIGR